MRWTSTGSCLAAGAVAFLALGACSSSQETATPPALNAEARAPEPPGASAAVPSASASPVVPTSSSPTSTTAPADVTQQAAGRFVPVPDAAAPPDLASAVPAPGVDYADPLAVAAGYVAARLTYRFDDPVGYAAALTAPAFTTPAFAARSTPSAAAVARLATSQETSAVQVGGAELAREAPNSGSTRYVVVTCTVTTAYRGGGDTTAAAWTVRLLQAPVGQWRVDGVLSTGDPQHLPRTRTGDPWPPPCSPSARPSSPCR